MNPEELFGSAPKPGQRDCRICEKPKLRGFLRNTLEGMLDSKSAIPLWLSTRQIAESVSKLTPEQRSSLELPDGFTMSPSGLAKHLARDEKELWERVKKAKRAAGYLRGNNA